MDKQLVRYRQVGVIGNHTIFAAADPATEPIQWIGVTPDDTFGVSVLYALTGNEWLLYGWVQHTRLPDGSSAAFVPHDKAIEDRMAQVVGIIASLIAAPIEPPIKKD